VPAPGRLGEGETRLSRTARTSARPRT
jgi:hypothetical protein